MATNTLNPESATMPDPRTADFRGDVSKLAHDAMDVVRSGAGEIKHGAHEALEGAKDKLGHARDAVKEKVGEARDKASEAVASLKNVIAENPATSICVAVGVGVLLSLAMFRHRS